MVETTNKIIIASGPVIVENNKVLLDKHGDSDFWKFCGGQIKPGKNLQETAVIRSREELGIEVKILSDQPFLLYTQKNVGQEKLDVILVHYLAERLTPVKPADFIKDWVWLNLSDLEKENLAPNIIPTLKHFGFID